MKIETKRLILRPIQKSDKKSLIENINNIKISQWLELVPFPYTEADADWWINHCQELEKEEEKKSYEFVIILNETGEDIGGITLAEINKEQGTATLGYWIGEGHWRKGYGSEALDAVLKLAFEKLKLRRIEAGVYAGNQSSGRLLEKFGAKEEGRKIEAKVCKADGKIKDEIVYGLLKEDWKALE